MQLWLLPLMKTQALESDEEDACRWRTTQPFLNSFEPVTLSTEWYTWCFWKAMSRNQDPTDTVRTPESLISQNSFVIRNEKILHFNLKYWTFFFRLSKCCFCECHAYLLLICTKCSLQVTLMFTIWDGKTLTCWTSYSEYCLYFEKANLGKHFYLLMLPHYF